MHVGHVLAVKEKDDKASRRGTQCFDEQVTTQASKRATTPSQCAARRPSGTTMKESAPKSQGV
jgi:hypothetical protein